MTINVQYLINAKQYVDRLDDLEDMSEPAVRYDLSHVLADLISSHVNQWLANGFMSKLYAHDYNSADESLAKYIKVNK